MADKIRAFWEHELEELDCFVKEYGESKTDSEKHVWSQRINEKLEFLKQEVFFDDLTWNEENGVLTCASRHDEAGRIGYLNEILAQFKISL